MPLQLTWPSDINLGLVSARFLFVISDGLRKRSEMEGGKRRKGWQRSHRAVMEEYYKAYHFGIIQRGTNDHPWNLHSSCVSPQEWRCCMMSEQIRA
jgi:hypothetical protein